MIPSPALIEFAVPFDGRFSIALLSSRNRVSVEPLLDDLNEFHALCTSSPNKSWNCSRVTNLSLSPPIHIDEQTLQESLMYDFRLGF